MSDAVALRSVPTFVVNLPRDVARRQHMAQLLAERGLDAEFIPAVDGSTLSAAERAAYDHDRALRVYGVAMMDGELGCYLSHYRLYERIVRERIETALVLEDDLEISPDLPAVVQGLVACDRNWLIVRLESQRDRIRTPPSPEFVGRRVADLPGGAGLYRLRTHVLGTGAYLIRREGAARMLEYGRRIFMPIDHTLDRFWENGILPYVVRPFPVRQRSDFESRIGTRGPDRHKSQPFIIHLQRRLQRVGDSLRKRAFNWSY
jgi:glycosyl transferase family 25